MTLELVVGAIEAILMVLIGLQLAIFLLYFERKGSALIQDRVGPNRVGIYGLVQPIADAVKLLLKEDFTPAHVNKFYYW